MRLIGIVSVMAMVLIGCKPPLEKFGVKYNDQRRQRSIPIIDETWTRKDPGNEKGAKWESDAARPCHASKRIRFDGGTLLSDSDTYVSAVESFRTERFVAYESVEIVYSYENERAGKDPWICYYDAGEMGARKITLREAEALLARWGIKRLNY